MIYLDNAATTMHKPQCVVDAVVNALTSMGNAGRGTHEASLDATMVVFGARMKLAQLFNAESPEQIVFTANSTQSLNIAIKGVINKGDHVITTEMEHNSVLRPLYEMEENGSELTIVKADLLGNININDVENAIKSNTKAIVCTHGSNLTGNLNDIEKIGAIAKKHGVIFIVDASQTAGVFEIDVQKMGIDILCFTGHKGMLGPQGTGGMVVAKNVRVRPLLSGGSGVQTYLKKHPEEMPTALEAGTLNAHGIAGLSAAVDYINETGMENIRKREQALMWDFYNRIKDVDGVKVYGDFSKDERCAIVTVNIWDFDSSQVSDVLYNDYGISTRPGAHCAPLMHSALQTGEQGAVRFSFSHFNTEEDVDAAVNAVIEIANEKR